MALDGQVGRGPLPRSVRAKDDGRFSQPLPATQHQLETIGVLSLQQQLLKEKSPKLGAP